VPQKPTAGDAALKFKGMMAGFELHFRFMHTPEVFTGLKAKIFDKCGFF
jgi:hypothetical protein